VTIAVYEWGEPGSPKLVCLHGVTSHGRHFRPLAERLADRFHVLALDQRGHGDSTWEPPWHLEQYVEDALAATPADRCTWLGHSFGGRVAYELAAAAPERVERLVVSCTSAFLGPPDGWAERARIVRADGMESIADSVVVRWFTPDLPREEPETVARFRAMLVATPAEGYARCCEALAAWDARERISAISVPTLVVAGAEDPATPVEHAELLASRIPDARLHVLERAAHLANVERAYEFTSAVLDHLGREVPV
jgi:3-oxoadipate enol-lactonase